MAERARVVRTTCPYCGVGCGVLATPQADGSVAIAGDPDHPANKGRLCSKGTALGETLSLDDRLLHPLIDGRRVEWDVALDRVALGFGDAIREHGPDSVALYVSGQLLTEDYYVANKLMKGFIGSANIDTNSRLCMASSVAGHKRAFGSDTVPGCYEDLEQADLVVLVGSNLAWCHPVLFQRLAAAREARGTRIVVIDPRRTATCEIADLHLPIKAGGDVALFNGLLAHLAETGRIDRAYVSAHTTGLDEALAVARRPGPSEIARLTGLSVEEIERFYALYAATERAVTVYSQGVNQSSAGTDKVNAILNCHLATGRIGRPGMGPFSVTGQPNAMGGREVGGLANMLAAHMELADPAHRRIVADFWGVSRVPERPGLKAVDLFRAVGEGRIKALWIMGTNPAVSMPEADKVREAMANCPFVVVSDVVRSTDTTALGHVLLPSLAWGEKDGTVTNSERRISRQRSFLAAPGEARADWWQLAEVAGRLGHRPAFAWTEPAQIFAEYAALTAAGNHGTRDLDIGAHAGIDRAAYDALPPFQWPQPAGLAPSTTRFFANGAFYTPDRKARLVPTPSRAPAQQPSAKYPLVLNTGRIRDQWHTMTRTAKAARLMAMAPEPFCEIAPDAAARFGIADRDLIEVESANGRAVMRAVVSASHTPGAVFVPMHWTSELASCARINSAAGGATDPVSGQPELKHIGVAVRRYTTAWTGFAVTTRRPPTSLADYVAIAPVAGGYRVELAGERTLTSEQPLLDALLGGDLQPGDVIAYRDTASRQQRFAAVEDGRLTGALFLGRGRLAVARDWLAESLGRAQAPEDRLRLLAGRPGKAARPKGAIVCACLGVGRNEIVEAIVTKGAATVDAVGACVKAGTNCGSCRADIKRIIDEARLEKAG